MTNNQKYPKEIITYEKTTEDSEKTNVITIVKNAYEENAVNTAIAYMNAFNKCDDLGCDEALNFPHVRVGMKGNLTLIEKPPQFPPKFFERFNKATGWKHSCWDFRRVVQSSPDKVHLVIQFSRYRFDGMKIGEYPSFWVITKQKGHWGIKMRSSFAL